MKRSSNFIHILVSTAIVFLLLLPSSCKKDDHTDYSTLVKSNPQVRILGVPSSVIIREDTAGVILTVSVTLSEPQISEIHLPIKQIAGDAKPGLDYTLSANELVFEPYTTGPQVFKLEILDDDIVEGDELLKLQVGDETVANATIEPVTTDITITNATNLDLNLSFNWGRSYLLHYWNFTGSDYKDTTLFTGTSYNPDAIEFISNYPVVDLDFFVFDSLGSSGGNELGTDQAKQSGHPERYTFSAPDDTGVYVVASLMYYNIFRDLGYGTLSLTQGSFPIRTTIQRKGVLNSVTMVQDSLTAYTTDTQDLAVDGEPSLKDLFKVEVKPNMFIVYNLDGTTFATARKKKFVPHSNKVIPLSPKRYK